MILSEKYQLSNGVETPKLGLGTWFIDNDDAADAVVEAVKLGYRHIDTAQAYGNERGVGEGIKVADADREDLFITTKLAAEIKTYDEAKAGIDQSLKDLDLDYIDLMIIHSPQPWNNFQEDDRFFEGNLEAWKALEEAYEEGKLRAIGVSNFEQGDLENILNNGTVKPMVNQVLAHISNTPFNLIKFCQDNDILLQAYSPIAHGELLKNKEVAEIAEKYDVSIPQLSIRYTLQLGLLPLPKTANPEHMKTNADVNFTISDEDMETLKNAERIKDYGDSGDMPVFDPNRKND